MSLKVPPSSLTAADVQVMITAALNAQSDQVRSDAEINALVDAKLNEPYTVATLSGTWTHFTPERPVKYKKLGSTVFLTGTAAGGANATDVLTLPVGFRPAQHELFLVPANRSANVYARITIFTDGRVLVARVGGDTSGNYVWLALAGISFEVA